MKRTVVLLTAVGAASGVAAEPPPPPRPLAAELVTLGMRRRVELEALAPEAVGGAAFLPARGACARPDDARVAALRAQVEAWIAGRPAARGGGGTIGSLVVGCDEPGGIVVDVQADLTARGRRTGWWWTLRVGPRAVELIDEVSGAALVDYTRWTRFRTSSTLVLADLDGDGAAEPLVMRDEHEGGQGPSMTVAVPGPRGRRDVGHHPGSIDLARLQPPVEQRTIVVRLDGAAPVYRCIDGAQPWHPCPAADAAAAHDRAWDAALALQLGAGKGYDADQLERALRDLGVPPAERAPLVARAVPASLAVLIRRAAEDAERARQGLTADEAAAEAAADEAALAAELRAATGDAPCPEASAAQRKAASSALRAWATRVEPRAGRRAPTAPVVLGSCVGPRGAYWLARWQVAGATRQRREAVFFTAGKAAPSPVLDASFAIDDAAPGLAAKFSLVDGTLTALVESGGQLTAIVDGTARGAPAAGQLLWSWDGAHVEVRMRADSLARSVDTEQSDSVVYLRATAAGLAPAVRLPPPSLHATPTATDPVGLLLEPRERARRARQLAATVDPALLSNPTYRADLAAALRLLDADPALAARLDQP